MSEYKMDAYEADVMCRLMWLYMADEGCEYKDNCSFWKEHNVDMYDILNECFACDFTRDDEFRNSKYRKCRNCLYSWGYSIVNDFACEKYSSIYRKWRKAKTKRTRKKYARMIANQPVREKYKKACSGE